MGKLASTLLPLRRKQLCSLTELAFVIISPKYNFLYIVISRIFLNITPLLAMGYISEGESTIDIQSQQAATLHMITIRVILPQFTKIG